MVFENNYINVKTIDDAWRNSMWCCVRNGYDYMVKQGSYVGQIRRQLDWVTIHITEPWTRPLAPFTPQGIPSVTTDEKIEEYFSRYILGYEKKQEEDYTYGQYILPQIQKTINILQESKGFSNQACINIGDTKSIHLNSPPCLRTITFKVVDGKLNMSIFFRSWDLFVGLPENLGGLQLLKEYVLIHLKHAYAKVIGIEDGDIIAFSDGLHLYQQYFPIVNILCVDKIGLIEEGV